MNEYIQDHIIKITHADGRYGVEAYQFIMDSLSVAQKHFQRERHVLAAELLFGVCTLAVKSFGPLAGQVLARWGIRSGMDVGQIVFNMVDHGLLCRQDNDVIEDFNLYPDLAVECRKFYAEQLKRSIKKVR